MTTPFSNIVPDSTRVSSGFSTSRVDPVSGAYARPHKGVDIAAPNGSPINSPADGVVVKIGDQGDTGWGNYVVVQHKLADGTVVITIYGHLDAPSNLKKGQKIYAGTQIGKVGSSGHSSGNHLHYEERKAVGTPDKNGIYPWNKAIPQDPATNKFGLNGSDPNGATACTPSDLDGNGTPDWIDWIKNKFKKSKTIVSPIVLDLNCDGITTTGLTDGAYFDHDGNGFAEQTSWVSGDDGILVRDLNGNGTIDTGGELFGSETRLSNGQKAANGYEALAELDTNQDGQIDQLDSAYSTLKVWRDIDGNGYSSAGELVSLADAGVLSIATGFASVSQTDANGNLIQQTGTFTKTDGSIGDTADIWFQVNKTDTIATDWLPETAAVAALPDLQGYGNVRDLHQAILRDNTGHLQDLVQQFVNAIDPATRHALTNQLIYAWVGVENIAANSRGYIADARQLCVLEAFLGEGYIQGFGTNADTPNTGPNAARYLTGIYDELANDLYSQLMAQTHYKPLLDSIVATWNATTSQFDWDVSGTVALLNDLYMADISTNHVTTAEFADVLKLSGDSGKQVLDSLRAQGDATGSGFAGWLGQMGSNSLVGDEGNNRLISSSDYSRVKGGSIALVFEQPCRVAYALN